MWFYFLLHLIECAVKMFSVDFGQVCTTTNGPTSSRIVKTISPFFPHAVSLFSPLVCASCIVFFTFHVLMICSVHNFLTSSTVLFVIYTSLCLSLPSFLISFTSLFWISLFLHHSLVWSDLCVLNSCWVTFSPHSYVKNFLCCFFPVTFQGTLHFVCSR